LGPVRSQLRHLILGASIADVAYCETGEVAVRDTIIAILVLLGTTTLYFSAKQYQKSHSVLPTSSKLVTQTKTLHQGEHNESASHRGRQQVESDIESNGSEEGSSSSFEQAESFPSIYQDEEPELSRSAVNLEEEIESESNESAVVKPKQPVVYGVPVASWLKHQKNRLASKVEAKNPTGMRLFFNCMELKKEGTEPLSQRDCKEIAVSREKSRGAALIQ